jgi:multiple antibiotic resistance protein
VSEFAQFALVTFTSVLFLVDPVAVLPAFLAITEGETPDERRVTARRACIYATAILVAFAAGGSAIFRLFGITLNAFRIAGGLILWLVAIDMLRGQRTTQEGHPEIAEGQGKEDVAITPLAMPMLAGPGAISTVMVLAGQARSPARAVVVYAAILLTMLISWALLRMSDRLFARLGQTGIRVVTRLMGLLLAALAVQFIISGVSGAMQTEGIIVRPPAQPATPPRG